ncbi:MAG: hypothetical protein ACPGSC_10465, partial [Granulosicoccaceae bacterium]
MSSSFDCHRRSPLAKACFALLISASASWVSPAFAEGSAQFGLTQRMLDYDRALAQGGYASDADSASLFVDVMSVGEVINISACGRANTDSITVDIFDPSGSSVFGSAQTLDDGSGPNGGLIDCNNPMTAPLTNPFRYASTTTGAYRIEMQNTTGTAFNDSFFERFDISITPDTTSYPDPTAEAGRLWAYSWNINAGSFSEADSTDANLYALVPGGRPDTNYIWMLDLNNFAGYGYSIVANNIGVDAPNSGYSTPTSGNTVSYQFPVYTGVPAIADPQPVDPPEVSGLRFIDSEGEDAAISPGSTVGVQDSGSFEFDSDIAGTYAIFIDIDRDGSFGDAGDVLLLGETTVGLNSVSWDGNDASGNPLPANSYNARVTVRMGEYHFIANDVETSGGPSEDGLTIFQSDQAGNLTNTQVYWDDETLLGGSGGTSTLPNGVSSSTAAGRHTWGDFSSTGFGNVRYVDTYVYGLSAIATTIAYVVGDDTPVTGADGSVDLSDVALLGDSLTVTVTDGDLNTNPAVIESVAVVVVNDRTGEFEQIMLTETGPGTAVFSASLATAAGSTGNNSDGVLNANMGDTATATYQDQLDAAGNAVTRTDAGTLSADSDGDGTADSADSAPADACVPNMPSASCSDSDGDGYVDFGTATVSFPLE